MTQPIDGYALGRFDDGTGPFTGLALGDRVLRLPDDGLVKGAPTYLALLEEWATVSVALPRLASEAGPGDGLPLSALRVLAPVEPRQIIQAGANYRSHVAQMIVSGKASDDTRSDDELRQAAEREMEEKVRHGLPFLFAGLPSALTGPDDDVVLPPEAAQVDWEAELAVVIGTRAHRVSRDRAMDHIAGYTVCNDVSARDLQFPPENKVFGGDWLRAKNRPTFLPTGPFLVPADQVPDHRQLRITFDLNGERLQDDLPASMLFDVPNLIAAASVSNTLLPGDLLLTGSPAGNGGHWRRWLRPGDVMVAAIAGLGAQRNRCVAEIV
ncbi:fumarylacetoacetate hydrolase family protein [Frankia sp. Ag45/Mut15]|uniref:Fumarylacetoacetate hydrolase family protein n=1 Tax=Frankia umida TaxID=573489 RepID=A0ABT0K4Z5_9ACTN|nr:fumarylacetoacetate hydrolase family protein [Frankia umida]MCK9878867.1 fumarylacetoacetate hydrolase family protein [Frankia umida]